MRVLFVEDSDINRRIVREMLGAAGIDMAEAADGQVGLEMIERDNYDLVLLDLRMPNMDGLTALKHLRARADEKAKLPVIVLTADTGSRIEADCRGAGADDVIMKPVSMSQLYDAIGRMVARRGADTVVLS
jgi:CheY-like chemotaxis protein